MIPYKGHLIESVAVTRQMPSGFGPTVPGPSMLVWTVRIIDCRTGSSVQLPEQSSIEEAKKYIDMGLDPTGKLSEQERVSGLIKEVNEEITECENVISLQQIQLGKLKERLDFLKEEYKAIGSQDE